MGKIKLFDLTGKVSLVTGAGSGLGRGFFWFSVGHIGATAKVQALNRGVF